MTQLYYIFCIPTFFKSYEVSTILAIPSIRAVQRCIKIHASTFFLLTNNFSFLYLSHHTIFESETLQFTETFEIECGKNTLVFL
jgi:hypothetical protein